MLFNSFEFLFGFLPLCLAGYFLLTRVPRLASIWLALASLVFYGLWQYDPATPGKEARRLLLYVALLCGSTGANYLAGYFLQKRPRKWLLALGISANLVVLGYFKYSAFLVETLNTLSSGTFEIPRIILPLAISFYTFTQIAFLVDAYRGLARELSFARYCLFVFFFPHLIAGPIVHHSDIMRQFSLPEAKRWNLGNVSAGILWLSLGLFKKVVIADSFAPLANSVFAHAGSVSILEAWCGVLAYTFQLYFDFSGYSDMAIGVSLFFNIRLPDNFNAPYRATSIVDFWRRWHITLSRFLRDYLYIPLGGNRRGPAQRYINLFLTMLLGGIWHGAGWTYLIWGGYHGILLIGCHLWQGLKRPLPLWIARLGTFIAVVIGWAIFRAKSLSQAHEIFSAMIDFGSFRMHSLASSLQVEDFAFLAGILMVVNMAPTTKQWIESRRMNSRDGIVAALLFVCALLLMRNTVLQFRQSEFIYFQF
ncbi:MAG: rane-bound O-acyltransferase family protein [Chthoniobacteraceae bacterium]|nr:rane-bound O-acyltransferase family protein [Chthoniobacteraceae bacterium]